MQIGIPQPKYPFIDWHKEWAVYCDAAKDLDTKVALYKAIVEYGLNEIEPNLPSAQMEYFNTSVRPEIDRQHNRFNRKWK